MFFALIFLQDQEKIISRLTRFHPFVVQKLKKMRIHLSLTSFLNPSISNLLFITFFAFHLPLCSCYDAHDEFKACGVVYNCGELVNISYPFWGNERQDFCGRREFKLNCTQNRTTTIEIDSVVYNVLNISQSNQRMKIARSDLSDNYCPKSKIETATLDHHLFYYPDNDRNISVWYDCPLQLEMEKFRFSCGWDGEKYGRANYALEQEERNWSVYMGGCEMKIEVTVTIEGLEEGKENRTARVEKALKRGFDVEYRNLYTVACEGCNATGGKCATNGTYPFYCICGSGEEAHPYFCIPPPPPSRKSNLQKILVIVAVASGSIVLLILLIVFIYYTRKRISTDEEIEEIFRRHSTHIPKRYSYSKLKKITHSFKNKLGQGGFSTVYKGKLLDGRDVAVKLLNEPRENSQDFINEVVSITKTSHVNIATLLGFCYEQNKRALVYEYMPKGSLDKYIFHKDPQRSNMELDWNTLYTIVIGVARGLEYLHRGCKTRILHFDIKPHNILLDNEFCPKISDFGLAKQCRARESHVSMTGAKGTVGFMAPELVFRNIGKVSHKSDVYSYGMLVLEMVGERKNPNEGVGERSEEYFPDWIYKDLTQSAIDGGCWWGNTEEEEEMARKMVIVGLHCIQTLPEERPSMSDVVAMLEGSVDGLKIPPKPNLLGPPAMELPQHSSSSTSN